MKKGERAAVQEPPADSDLIPAGYMTPPRARPCHAEVGAMYLDDPSAS